MNPAVTRTISMVRTACFLLVPVAMAGSLMLIWIGANPLEVAPILYEGAFGNFSNLGETLIRFIPVALIALALIPSLMIGVFNIGAPGQMAFGAFLGSMMSLAFPGLPTVLQLPLAAICAAVGGGLVAAACGLLKARLNVNEILSTLVLNIIVTLLLEYLLSGPLQGARANLPQSDALPRAAWIPTISPGSRAHWGILVVALLFGAMLLLRLTPLGYRLRLFGASPALAKLGGVKEASMVIWTMAFAGAFAGVAGWMQVAGVDHRLYSTVANPVGYTGLFAALLGRLDPLGALISSFVFAALLRGGDYLQIGAGISPELISTLLGLVLLIISARSMMASAKRS